MVLMPESDTMSNEEQTQTSLLVQQQLSYLVVEPKDGKETAQVGTWLKAIKLKFETLHIPKEEWVKYARVKLPDSLMVKYEEWRVLNGKTNYDWEAFEVFLYQYFVSFIREVEAYQEWHDIPMPKTLEEFDSFLGSYNSLGRQANLDTKSKFFAMELIFRLPDGVVNWMISSSTPEKSITYEQVVADACTYFLLEASRNQLPQTMEWSYPAKPANN